MSICHIFINHFKSLLHFKMAKYKRLFLDGHSYYIVNPEKPNPAQTTNSNL